MTALYRLTLLVFTVFLFCAVPAFAQDESGEFGRWPFPDSVDALPKECHPGQPFAGFPRYQRTVDWMAIPNWLAGDWLSKDYRILKTLEHSTGVVRTIPTSTISPIADHFGDQIDNRGNAWSCNITPFTNHVLLQQQGMQDSQYVFGMKALEVKADQVAVWQRIIHAIVNPQNNQIHDSYTEERVTEFIPSGEGMITAQGTSAFYDPNGEATYTTNTVRLMRLTKPFRPAAQRFGVDLEGSFIEYLQNSGRGNLVRGAPQE